MDKPRLRMAFLNYLEPFDGLDNAFLLYEATRVYRATETKEIRLCVILFPLFVEP